MSKNALRNKKKREKQKEKKATEDAGGSWLNAGVLLNGSWIHYIRLMHLNMDFEAPVWISLQLILEQV